MKKLNVVALWGILSATTPVWACPHSQSQFICPGDPIADANGLTGKVLGINAHDQEAAVQYDNGQSNEILTIASLALAEGCIGSICVKDRVADSNGTTGSIIALNPNNYTAAVQYDNGQSNEVLSLGSLEYSMGCMGLYCVGDRVYDSNGTSGTLIALGYFNRTGVILYDNGQSNEVLNVESFALGRGCIKGDCVKDTGTDDNGSTGTVVGVNPITQLLVFQYDNGQSNQLIGLNQFMSSEYCTTYGQDQRTVDQYIEAKTDAPVLRFYAQADGFHFGMNRE